MISRVQETFTKYNVSLLIYLIDKCYAGNVKTEIRRMHELDVLTDSVRQPSRDPYDKYSLNMLLIGNIVAVLIISATFLVILVKL